MDGFHKGNLWPQHRGMTELPLPDASGLSDPRLELALLGALLASPRLLEELPPRFSGDHLTDPHHRTLFSALIDFGAGEANATAIQLALRGSIPDDLVPRAIAAMTVPDRSTIRQYADDVSNLYDRRQLLAIADRMRAEALMGEAITPVAKIRAQAQVALDNFNDLVATEDHDWVSLGEAANRALWAADRAAAGGHLVGLSTGFPSIDEAIGGLEAGTFTLIGARPGMGKSALALGMAKRIAPQLADGTRRGAPGVVLVFSLEMSAESQARRSLAEIADVPSAAIRRGRHAPYADDLRLASHTLQGLPIYFHDVRTQSVSHMRAMARKAARLYGRIGAIIVDHLHIVAAEDADRRRNETELVSRISTGVRQMGKEFDCPVIALAQLSRDVEKRDNKRPVMADLRQSGTLEQDADFILFLYREEYYLRQEGQPRQKDKQLPQAHRAEIDAWDNRLQEVAGKAEVIIGKAREDEQGQTIELRFNSKLTAFSDPSARMAEDRP